MSKEVEMGKKRTSYKVYGVWDYEKEIADLNEQSKLGWQLEKGGCYHSVFRKDDTKKYIYQLDYNTKIKDKTNYIDFFEEQGWEFLNSTFNGWHYFRKEDREDLKEEEKVIYTDTDSLLEMQDRWYAIIKVFSILYPLLALIMLVFLLVERDLRILLDFVIMALFGVTFILARISVKRKREGKSAGFTLPGQWICIAAILFFIALIILW